MESLPLYYNKDATYGRIIDQTDKIFSVGIFAWYSENFSALRREEFKIRMEKIQKNADFCTN